MNYRQAYKIVTLILMMCPCAANAQSDTDTGKRTALDLRNRMELADVVSKVASARVIYVGETHDRYADHLIQLEIIQRLYAQNPNIAIGMEQFQQPFQHVLDRYISGELDEKELIRQSEWMERWRYDYRLYRPILSYAQEHQIPVVALNAPKEIVAQVSEKGFAGLSADDKKKIPSDIDESDREYRERLKDIYEKHAHKGERGFEGFFQVQLLWDETMAARAAQYLQVNPERQLVVLAGAGHLIFGSGIPQRVSRRVVGERAIIVPNGDFKFEPDVADFLVYGSDEKVPEPGRLGLHLEDTDDGVEVGDLVPDGAAKDAGVEKGDLIRSINGQPVKDVVDLKLLLLDAAPEDMVSLAIFRRNLIQKDDEIELIFRLGK